MTYLNRSGLTRSIFPSAHTSWLLSPENLLENKVSRDEMSSLKRYKVFIAEDLMDPRL